VVRERSERNHRSTLTASLSHACGVRGFLVGLLNRGLRASRLPPAYVPTPLRGV
jgi:hypothetical protein